MFSTNLFLQGTHLDTLCISVRITLSSLVDIPLSTMKPEHRHTFIYTEEVSELRGINMTFHIKLLPTE